MDEKKKKLLVVKQIPVSIIILGAYIQLFQVVIIISVNVIFSTNNMIQFNLGLIA